MINNGLTERMPLLKAIRRNPWLIMFMVSPIGMALTYFGFMYRMGMVCVVGVLIIPAGITAVACMKSEYERLQLQGYSL